MTMPPRPPQPPPNSWSFLEQSLSKFYNAMGTFLRAIPDLSQHRQRQHRQHGRHHPQQMLGSKALTVPRILILALTLMTISLSQHYTYTTILVSYSVSDGGEVLSFQDPVLSGTIGPISGSNTRTRRRTSSVRYSAIERNNDTLPVSAATKTTHDSSIPSICTSPERHVPWPLHGTTQSRINPSLTCGVQQRGDGHLGGAGSAFAEYFREVLIPKQVQPIMEEEQCQDLVVFGVAFGEHFLNLIVEREQATRVRIAQASNQTNARKKKSRNRGSLYNPQDLIDRHHRCFFMFVLQEESDKLILPDSSSEQPTSWWWRPSWSLSSSSTSSSTPPRRIKSLGHNWLIPIPSSVLPYENMRRNAKLLKYMGHLAFTGDGDFGGNNTIAVKTIIWQDAKFLRFDERVIPRRYDNLFQSRNRGNATTVRGIFNSTTNTKRGNQRTSPQPCITSMGLPIHESAFFNLNNQTSYGRTFSYRPRYEDHCRAIIDALTERPSVTDSPESLMDQCRTYMEHIAGEENAASGPSLEGTGANMLDHALIDSAFIVWNESTEMCREFNAALRCTIMDQIHCHSDRDQVNIPFALYHMGLEAQYMNENDVLDDPRNATELQARPVDDEWQTRVHDLKWVYKRGNDTISRHRSDVLLRIIPSSCHWYYTFPIGRRDDCNRVSWLPSPDEWMEDVAIHRAEQGLDKLSRAKRTLFKSSASTIQSATLGRHDYRECTSPEYHVPWPPTPGNGRHGIKQTQLVPADSVETQPVPGDNVDTRSPCGMEEWQFFNYLQSSVWTRKIKHTAVRRCHDLVVFDATFDFGGSTGTWNAGNTSMLFWNTSDLHQMKGKCRFTFVYHEDLYASINKVKKGRHVFYGDNLLLPISRSVMPYDSNQRNANLLKYMLGPSLLGNISTIVWNQGDSTVAWNRGEEDRSKDDSLLSTLRQKESGAEKGSNIPCLTSVGVPVGSKRESIYQAECKRLILLHLSDQSGTSKTARKLKRDTTFSLTEQCDAYIQHVYGREMGTHFLDQGVVNTSVLVWNESTEECRDFNAVLRCIMLNQGHCHSGRDEVVFPFALYQIGLSSYFFPELTENTAQGSTLKELVNDFEEYANHVIDFQDRKGGPPLVRVIRSNTTSLIALDQTALE